MSRMKFWKSRSGSERKIMSIFDFDTPVNRRGLYSMKWDVAEGELPMWVADMDFETAPCVKEALARRVENGTFGYTDIPQEWKDAYISWNRRRHHWDISEEQLIFTSGTIPAISSIVRRMTEPAEKVLFMTPIYNTFYNCVVNQGRRVEEFAMDYDQKTLSYSINWEKLEETMTDPMVRMMIFNNPHNPIGKIWDRETLEKVGRLAAKHHVLVLSDEVHCDLVTPGKEYIPFASVNEVNANNSITCISPSKTFNLAGLHSAAVVIPDEGIRQRVDRGLNNDEAAEPNAFAIQAAVAAFNEGEEWLGELNDYIQENRNYVSSFLAEHIPELKLIPAEATYLLWVDVSALESSAGKKVDDFAAFIREKTGLYISKGASYGKGGEKFVRINVACPKSYVEDGMQRLAAGVLLWKQG